MKPFRVKLDGEHAHLGSIPAADVARMLMLVEKAAAQAAAIVLGQPKTTTGRYRGVIERSVHFRLVAIEEGSVVPVLELPEFVPFDADASMDLDDPRLGESALDALFDTAKKPTDPLMAKVVLDLADGMYVGDRYDAIVLELPAKRGRRRKVKLDGKVRRRLQRYVESTPAPDQRSDDVVGVLFEADFERRTARLRTPGSQTVEVSFTDEHADDIQAALRQRSTVRGDVVFDPMTQTARRVKLTEIVRRVDQLTFDPDAFWEEPSFDELAARQGIGGPVDPSELYDREATDEERDAVVAALAELE